MVKLQFEQQERVHNSNFGPHEDGQGYVTDYGAQMITEMEKNAVWVAIKTGGAW